MTPAWPHLVSLPAGVVTLRDARTNTTREVSLRPFSLAATPVTRAQFVAAGGVLAVSGETGEPGKPGEPANAPVHSLSWREAIAWCNDASRLHGLAPAYSIDGAAVSWDVSADGYRLPTEAEWEFACRAGTSGPHYGALNDIAWTEADGLHGPADVAQKLPNAFGLFDTLGNVWEWCWNFADPARYADYRALRGGGWADKHWSVRASVRRGSMPGAQLDDVGFRVARGAVGTADDHAAQGWSRHEDRARAGITGPLPVGWTPLRDEIP